EVGAGDVGDRQGDHLGPALPQLLTGHADPIAELGDRRLDAGSVDGPDPVGVVDHIGDRLPGDAGTLGDILDAGAFLAHCAQNSTRASLNSRGWEVMMPCGPPGMTTTWLCLMAWWVRWPDPSNGTI